MSIKAYGAIADTIRSHRVSALAEEDCFEGLSLHPGAGRIYGGQAMAQAINAAGQTVPPSFVLHSYHCYFLRAGDPKQPVHLSVARIRDGRSFCNRRVVVSQGKREILTFVASYHVPEPGLDFQLECPQVPGPEGLPNDADLLAGIFSEHGIEYTFPIEIRQVAPVDWQQPEVAGPRSFVWFRVSQAIDVEQGTHQELLAYLSDNPLLVTALRPHGKTHFSPGMQVASLDHALWFHRPIDMNQWMLYDLQAVTTVGARGFVTANVFDQHGALVASVSQEGLLRCRP